MLIRVTLQNKKKTIEAVVYCSDINNDAHLKSQALDHRKIPVSSRADWRIVDKRVEDELK